ncbi:MAG TPA: (2Fe-2S)-binding protein [Tepidisphaeraceae bacterium]|jgi:aerobic-type carbon monoxide dehydrogenase small subunit (CoxS/CutS family)|nr:(2Fe-2S)-binding protein [Tepidisphaeraceae bacterium]
MEIASPAEATGDSAVAVTVNGKPHRIAAPSTCSLLEVLREELRLTGTRYGCGSGDCGACAVHVDGKRALACTTTLADVADRSVTTIEGLATGDQLQPVQQAFLDDNAFQCGYCTSGMIMTAVALLNEQPDADDAALLKGMDANLCRCCGYERILATVRRAAAMARQGGGR